MLTHVSLCSGAGGMDLGFHNAGFVARAFCEFDAGRRGLLAKHWPGVPCHPDIATLDPADLPSVDCLIGGTPCQDLSIAGQQAGFGGHRSVLFFHFMRIRNALNPRWTVWENVDGALSSHGGLDFAQVLGAFVGARVVVPGGGWARAGVVAGPWGGAVWRVLNAQHFGVPQRRNRVFVVGHLGGPCPPEVLFELAGGGRDPAASEDAQAHVAATLSSGSSRPGVNPPGRRKEDDVNIVGALDCQHGGADDNTAQAGHLVVASTLRSHPRPGSASPGNLVADTLRGSVGKGGGGQKDGVVVAPALTGRYGKGADRTGSDCFVADELRGERQAGVRGDGLHARADDARREAGRGLPGDQERILAATPDADGMREADGLAGWLDGAVSRFDPRPDGFRYSACGDGVVAPVAEWIARRIVECERLAA